MVDQINPDQYNLLLSSFLEKPDQVDQAVLNQLIEQYPFSQPLHFIYAAKQKNDHNAFEKALPKASAYAPKREVLYAAVHEPWSLVKVAQGMAPADTEPVFLTGNAVEPVSHFEEVDQAMADADTETEDNINTGLPEDFSSHDPIFEQILDETGTSAPQEDAEEEEPIEEISEVQSPYETDDINIVSPEHNAFIEADERGLIEDETFEEIAEAPNEEENKSEVEDSSASHFSEPEIETAENLVDEEEDRDEPKAEEKEEALRQDKLIGSIAGSDFFAFEKSAVDPLQPEEAAPKQTGSRANVSRYNDDKLPYTFLWWLDKTRKQHSGTYQPYANFSLDTTQVIRHKPVEELNHQIIENIFHLQTPLDNMEPELHPTTVEFEVKKKEAVIIEKFIKEEPQIKPPQLEKIDSENKARRSAEDPNDLVSETLARIYTDQMLYHKAIDTYKKLSLKFPEKSTFFANQIVELEKKIN
ncbi:MAG: hypothetical protein K0S09_2778 [Sphingobacteriaceae bacterium]|nr:hypothetical protein [Sphingobacteriaceae bacterium]